jgi:hypothetical protein
MSLYVTPSLSSDPQRQKISLVVLKSLRDSHREPCDLLAIHESLQSDRIQGDNRPQPL